MVVFLELAFGFFFAVSLVVVLSFLALILGSAFTTAGFSSPSWAGVAPIRYILVPHTEQLPVVTAAPRALNPASGLAISRFSLHFKQ